MKGVIVSLRSGGFIRMEWDVPRQLRDEDAALLGDVLSAVSDYAGRFSGQVIGSSNLPEREAS